MANFANLHSLDLFFLLVVNWFYMISYENLIVFYVHFVILPKTKITQSTFSNLIVQNYIAIFNPNLNKATLDGEFKFVKEKCQALFQRGDNGGKAKILKYFFPITSGPVNTNLTKYFCRIEFQFLWIHAIYSFIQE